MSFTGRLNDPDFYLSALAILGCLGLLYLFVSILIHVIRRKDMSRGLKIFWVILLFVAPPIAMVIYLAYQFQTYTIAHQYDWENANAVNQQARHEFQRTTGIGLADEIRKLNELKQSGLITSEEFSLLRSKLFTAAGDGYAHQA